MIKSSLKLIRDSVKGISSGNVRLDVYISEKIGLCSRSQLKLRIKKIIVNGKDSKLSRHVRTGDKVSVFYSDPPSLDIEAENIALSIIYEDNNVLVINKPQGMVVHPAAGNYSGTLVNALLFHYKGIKSQMNGMPLPRPGIVHRLDKDTSGVLIVAKNIETQEFLARQFRNRRVSKTYLAVVKGAPPKLEGEVSAFLTRDPYNRKRFRGTESEGKKALTRYKVLKFTDNYSFIVLKPKTGRTHQLRVHMNYIGCPILGDSLYSRKDRLHPDATLMLHAYKLSIMLPGDRIARTFRASLPARFKYFLSKF